MPALRLMRVLAVFVMAALAVPALAQSEAGVNARIDSVLGHHARYEAMIRAFQQSVAAGAREDVAAFIRYPIVVEIGGRKQTIRSASAFLQSYDAIMTPDIVDAITRQKYQDLFVNDQGVMFGDGQAWVDRVCVDRGCKQSVVKVVTLQHGPGN